MDRRFISVCNALTPASLSEEVRINRGTRVQIERRDRLLMHLIQHQTHHRGQAHTMLSGTRIKPPQLDEFFPTAEAPLPQRTDVVRAAGYGRFWFVQFQPGVRPCGGRGLPDAPRAAVADELASAPWRVGLDWRSSVAMVPLRSGALCVSIGKRIRQPPLGQASGP
jgi:DinB family